MLLPLPVQICDHPSLCPHDDPVFAAEASAGQALTPELTEALVQLLKVGAAYYASLITGFHMRPPHIRAPHSRPPIFDLFMVGLPAPGLCP